VSLLRLPLRQQLVNQLRDVQTVLDRSVTISLRRKAMVAFVPNMLAENVI
jgi:hypothetical protein